MKNKKKVMETLSDPKKTQPEASNEFESIESLLTDEERENIKSLEEYKEKAQEKLKQKDFDKAKELLTENYIKIIDVLKKYLDLEEKYYPLIAVWIIGTHFHKEFETYPYLFLNATRGSGKSRALRLISCLSDRGRVLNSINETTLFRTLGMIAIDEFESVVSKEKSVIRELLNASYKKGGFVSRQKKIKTFKEEKYEEEVFRPYRPIAMANISGMEDVLGDRCITIILEKSNDPIKTKFAEIFDIDDDILKIKENFLKISTLSQCSLCNLCSLVRQKSILKEWNNYLSNKKETTLNTHTTTDSLNYTNYTTDIELDSFFNKIYNSNINSRDFELFLPLFIITFPLGEVLFKEIIETAKEISNKKREDEKTENKDCMLIQVIANQFDSKILIKDLTRIFKEYVGEYDIWINEKWIGRALKRLNLIKNKRRLGIGIEVILDINKAKKYLTDGTNNN